MQREGFYASQYKNSSKILLLLFKDIWKGLFRLGHRNNHRKQAL